MDDERRERFTALYRSARPRVVAYALRRSTSTEDALDIVAETFAVAWRRLDDIPQGDDSLLWLYVTARNVSANEARRSHRRTELVTRAARALDQSGYQVPPRDDEGYTALECLRSLPEPDREVLMLSAWEGLGAAEIGRVLGCSPTAARIRLHQARRRLGGAVAAMDADAPTASKRVPPRGHARSEHPMMPCTPEEA